MAKYKIHPAIGIARVGNSTETFIGPEVINQDAIHRWHEPGKDWIKRDMKDASGKIKKQIARFRIWEYTDNGTPVREINLDNSSVEYVKWQVHLANKKAAFFCFNGQDGYSDLFTRYCTRRNDHIPEAEREDKLVADPGLKEIRVGQSDKGTVKFGPKFTVGNKFIPIQTLGELRTEQKGRLLVVGGDGLAKPVGGKPLETSTAGCHTVFNNDDWFDDVSDGPVTAVLKLKGQAQELEVDPAWVIVGPPDYAPSVDNIVTLYDTLIDIAVRRVRHPHLTFGYDDKGPELIDPRQGIYGPYSYENVTGKHQSNGLQWLKELYEDWKTLPAGQLKTFKPSFTRDIFPILYAAVANDSVTGNTDHSTGSSVSWDWKKLACADASCKPIRSAIVERLRDPDNPDASPMANMPLLFDDFFLENSELRLTVTRVQYAMLKQWEAGKFIDDWDKTLTGKPKPGKTITPEELDKAALSHCVGGAFCVGIEVSWLIRTNEFYSELFRVKPGAFIDKNPDLKTGPGFFTQQMALPWHTDFLACGDGWWPANRPVQVLVRKGGTLELKEDWAMGQSDSVFANGGWSQLGFVVEDNGELIEKEVSKPVPAGAPSHSPVAVP